MSQINIYRVDEKKLILDSNTDIVIENIYICSPCYNYIYQNNNLLKILKPIQSIQSPSNIKRTTSCEDSYKKQFVYNECYLCKRYIDSILNGQDIIYLLDTYIKSNDSKIKLTDEILLKLSKYSTFIYNDIYDYFNSFIKHRYNLERGDFLNINQAINNLDGLPNIDIINERAYELYFYLMHKIKGNSIK